MIELSIGVTVWLAVNLGLLGYSYYRFNRNRKEKLPNG